MSVLAHVGGFPLEETLGSAGPALLVAFGVAWVNLRARVRRVRSRAGAGGRTVSAAIATLAFLAAASPAPAKPGAGNSAATITGSFTDSCRDFTARSTKDISHAVIHYSDGGVAKDESTRTHDYSIDGGPGDEIDSVDVKSGTTRQTFTCSATNSPPTAILEIKTPPDCATGFNDTEYLACDMSKPRTVWTSSSEIPSEGLAWYCQAPYEQCNTTLDFRGTSSTDPDNDIRSWSIDFGDGASARGDWSTNPPTELTHSYPAFDTSPCCGTATLAVTDSAGLSDSDAISMVSIDVTPD